MNAVNLNKESQLLPDDRRLFESLAEPLKEWITKKGWPGFRFVQKNSIKAILLDQCGHAIIAEGTASGKTEAAFLPILSGVVKAVRAARCPTQGVKIICISPMKALIKDQERRIREMCVGCGFSVTAWTGDTPSDIKSLFKKEAADVLIITPESLETIVKNAWKDGEAFKRTFGLTSAIIFDEFHLFVDEARGVQAISLASRIEALIGKRLGEINRLALSATLSDDKAALDFLLRGIPDFQKNAAAIITGSGIKIGGAIIPGYVDDKNAPTLNVSVSYCKGWSNPPESIATCARILKLVDGKKSIVFCRTKKDVEKIHRTLSGMGSETSFEKHTADISSPDREKVEKKLNDEDRVCVVATSTIEVGVDIKDVDLVVQVGEIDEISSFRQRAGRSGRRSGKKEMILFCEDGRYEKMIDADRGAKNNPEIFAMKTLVAVAMSELAADSKIKAVEAAQPLNTHHSVFIQQILSYLMQCGEGANVKSIYENLVRRGVFPDYTSKNFTDILKKMGVGNQNGYIQGGSGDVGGERWISLTEVGKKEVEDVSFCATFLGASAVPFTVNGKEIGSVTLKTSRCGEVFCFGGRGYEILSSFGGTIKAKEVPFDADAAEKSEIVTRSVCPETHRKIKKMLGGERNELAVIDDDIEAVIARSSEAYRSLNFLDSGKMISVSGRKMSLWHWGGSFVGNTFRVFGAKGSRMQPFSTFFGPTDKITIIPFLEGVLDQMGAVKINAQRINSENQKGFNIRAIYKGKYDKKCIPDDLLIESYVNEEMRIDLCMDILRRAIESMTASR